MQSLLIPVCSRRTSDRISLHPLSPSRPMFDQRLLAPLLAQSRDQRAAMWMAFFFQHQLTDGRSRIFCSGLRLAYGDSVNIVDEELGAAALAWILAKGHTR